MTEKYELYIIDTETTGLDYKDNDIIEISMIRLSTKEQKVWWIKPHNIATITSDALRVNKHKLEDITHQTPEGKAKYQEASKVIIDIENWLMEDGYASEQRVSVGQNICFDIGMMESMWQKCDSVSTYPFGRQYLDTKQIAFLMDFCKDEFRKYYNLSNLVKDAGLKVDKAHTAVGDTIMTLDLFLQQVKEIKSLLKK